MSEHQVLISYDEKFGENPGIPWGGFETKSKADEYESLLKKCVERGTPLTDEERGRFFPEFEDGKVY